MNDEDKKITEFEDSVDNVTDTINDAISGIPAPIRKNAFKAFNQLCTAIIDIPVSYLEGIAAEKRAETNARVKIIDTGANQIASQMEITPEYAQAAVRKFGQKIVRERVNLDAIAKVAAKELSNGDQANNNKQDLDISQDWLNIFEKEACDKSSDEMRYLFGKILAGEIRKPSTYSIRTVKILSQLDTEAANVFRTLSSLTSTVLMMDIDGVHIIDSRVIYLDVNDGSNSLREYGLSFDALNVMQEYGLIIAEFNSCMDYQQCAYNDQNQLTYIFKFQGKQFALKRIGISKPIRKFIVQGVGLTKVGKELLGIIDIKPHQQYASKFFEFFTKNGFKCIDLHNLTGENM